MKVLALRNLEEPYLRQSASLPVYTAKPIILIYQIVCLGV